MINWIKKLIILVNKEIGLKEKVLKMIQEWFINNMKYIEYLNNSFTMGNKVKRV